MTDVRKLLDEVDPRPSQRDRLERLITDYEAAVDALASVAWNQSDGPCWCDHNIGGTEVTKHGARCQKARAALRRLRGDA